jgi:hypothetical protein
LAAGRRHDHHGPVTFGAWMRLRIFAIAVAMAISPGCVNEQGTSHAPIREQRLPSGKMVKVVSCLLAWGVEHDERHPDQDAFALEYVSSVPRVPPQDLEREAVEAFELIRPMSEQWGLPTATVAALRSPERTGTWDIFVFTRSTSGSWSHTSHTLTRNTE